MMTDNASTIARPVNLQQSTSQDKTATVSVFIGYAED